MAEYYKTGKIAGTHGLKGEVVFRHSFGKKTGLKGLQAIFIEDRSQSFLPWFIESVTIKNDSEVYLKLEGLDSKEAANGLNQKEVWLPEQDFKKYAAKSAPVNLLGYTIVDDATPLGAILEIIEQPHQLLCRIEIKGKEVLIPLHEDSLEKVDHRKKQVFVTLPDGLLDIYLG